MFALFVFAVAQQLGMPVSYEIYAWLQEVYLANQRVERIAKARLARKMGKDCRSTTTRDMGKGNDLEWNSPRYYWLDRSESRLPRTMHKRHHRPEHQPNPGKEPKIGLVVQTKAGKRTFKILSCQLCAWHRSTRTLVFRVSTSIGLRYIHVVYGADYLSHQVHHIVEEVSGPAVEFIETFVKSHFTMLIRLHKPWQVQDIERPAWVHDERVLVH